MCEKDAPISALEYHLQLQLYAHAAASFRLAHPNLANGNPNSALVAYNAMANVPNGYLHPNFPDSGSAIVPYHGLPLTRYDPRFRLVPELQKPSIAYIGLIGMAILSSPEQKMILSDIYQYILDNYPYFRNRGGGWRNSIRHNLSLNDCFVKSGRSPNGKGHFWAIHPANIEDFKKGDFRRRKAQRRVRKHLGLSVPEDEDSSSPGPPSTTNSMPTPTSVKTLIAPDEMKALMPPNLIKAITAGSPPLQHQSFSQSSPPVSGNSQQQHNIANMLIKDEQIMSPDGLNNNNTNNHSINTNPLHKCGTVNIINPSQLSNPIHRQHPSHPSLPLQHHYRLMNGCDNTQIWIDNVQAVLNEQLLCAAAAAAANNNTNITINTSNGNSNNNTNITINTSNGNGNSNNNNNNNATCNSLTNSNSSIGSSCINHEIRQHQSIKRSAPALSPSSIGSSRTSSSSTSPSNTPELPDQRDSSNCFEKRKSHIKREMSLINPHGDIIGESPAKRMKTSSSTNSTISAQKGMLKRQFDVESLLAPDSISV